MSGSALLGRRQAMEHCLAHNAPSAEMLYDDSLEQRRRDAAVPHAFRVHDDDGPARAHPETGRLAALDPVGPEEQAFTLQQRRQQSIELGAAPVGRAESAHAHQYMARVRLHRWLERRKRHVGWSVAAGEKVIAPRAMIERLELERITVLHARPERVTRPAVLFVHGYFADATVWNDWLAFFASRGFPAYALNLRGRGGSEPGASLGRASIADFVDDARLVVGHIAAHHGAPAAVGHSMGGLLVQLLAAEQLIRAAVLVAPAPPRGISVLSPRVALKQLKYLPAILGSRLVKPGANDLRDLVLDHLSPAEQNALIASLVPDSGRAGRDMSITGVPVDARRVRCPMLVVTGDDDHFIPRRISERVGRRYGAPVRLFAGHGHMLIVERGWQAVAETIADWLPEYV